MVSLTSFYLLTAIISHFFSFFSFYESQVNTILLSRANGNAKIYICGSLHAFTDLQVNPTVTTSANEKPRIVKNGA